MPYTEHFSFKSSDNKTDIYALCTVPDAQPYLGIIQICHGMCEYIDRYEDVFKYFSERGFIVCGHDHLGHGHSADKGQLGFFADENGDMLLVEDTRRLTINMKRRFGALPYFLLGHSMGSFIARIYASKYAEELDGAIFSGTGGPNPASPVGVGAASGVMLLQGAHHRSRALDKLSFGNYNKRCTPRRTDKDWLTRDSHVVDKYIKDPFCNFLFTASAFKDLFTLYSKANSSEWAKAVPQKLPIYLFSGDCDPVGNYGEGVKEVYRMLHKTSHSDVTIKLYPGGRHEMLNEINKLQVYEDVYNWIIERAEKLPETDMDLKLDDSF